MTNKTFSDHILENLNCDEKERDPLNITIADKIGVKDFITSYLGDNTGFFDHIIWTGYDVDECIKNIQIPCVIKPNNAWHRMVFVRSKNDINDELKKQLQFFITDQRDSWEWYYKQIKPGLIIEKLLPDHHTMHRVYVFAGKAKLFFNQRFNISKNSLHDVPDNTFYYAKTGQLIPVSWDKSKYFHRDFDYKFLSECAEKISAFPGGAPAFVRIDFFLIDGKPYFSEMTFLPDAASRHRFSPDDIDYTMGKWYREALSLTGKNK